MDRTDTRPLPEGVLETAPDRGAPRQVAPQGIAPDAARRVGAPDPDPARFERISIHAGSESGAPGALSGYAPRHLPLWSGLAFVVLTFGVQFAVRWQIPFPQCLLRKLTGIPCPTCGCTRSLLAWSNLDLAAAFRFNPLFFIVCVGVLAWLSLWGIERLTGRVWLERWGAKIPRGAIWKVFIALALVNWLYLCLKLPK